MALLINKLIRIYANKVTQSAGLRVALSNSIKQIDAVWSLTVWHEEGNKIIRPEKWTEKTFDADCVSAGYDFDEILPDDNTYIVTIKIRNWSVTNY